jgi:hypothetical protein
MNAEFRYKGPRREMRFRYVRREWSFLLTVILRETAIGVIIVKWLLGL